MLSHVGFMGGQFRPSKVIATQKREAKQRKMVYPFLIFLLFFRPCPFLCSDIAARAEGLTGPPSEERAQGVKVADD